MNVIRESGYPRRSLVGGGGRLALILLSLVLVGVLAGTASFAAPNAPQATPEEANTVFAFTPCWNDFGQGFVQWFAGQSWQQRFHAS